LQEGISPQQILLIDNHSNDESALFQLAQQHQTHFIANPKNGGYAYGNNQGIRYGLAQGFEYFLLLNPDVLISAASIQKLWLELQSWVTPGILGPRICEKEQPNIIFSDGGLLPNRSNCKASHTHYGKLISEISIEEKNTQVDYINGSALMFHKSVIEKIGYMKESFFMYFEETHWCMKAKDAGIPLMVLTSAVAYHEQSRKQQMYYYYMLRNRLWLVREFNPASFYTQCFQEVKRLLRATKNSFFQHHAMPPYYASQWKAIASALLSKS
jgi:hypothetical protein